MKYAVLGFIGLLLLAGPALAATTPTPTPSPTPYPEILVPGQSRVNVNAYVSFTTETSNVPFFNSRTRQPLSVPTGWTLYITDINWTCQSAANAYISWGTTGGILIDSVYFPNNGQGKSTSLKTAKFSVNPGTAPVLTTSEATGRVFIDGYLE